MTARPWGTTGRVTLGGEHKPGKSIAVNVNGVMRGRVGCPDEHDLNWWGTACLRPSGHRQNRNLPTLDAAVRWVLRRADADVWRQERGPVWRVKASPLWSPDGWVRGWLTTIPGGTVGICWPRWADAVACAHNNARAATP